MSKTQTQGKPSTKPKVPANGKIERNRSHSDGVSIIDLADLKPHPKNARKHTAHGIGTLVNSLQEVGAARSGVIDEDFTILAGNGTAEALAEAGIRKVKVIEANGEEWVVVKRTGLTKKQKERLALFDNRTAEFAQWNFDVLKDIAQDSPDWLSGLWSEKEIGNIKDGWTGWTPDSLKGDKVKLSDLKPHPLNYRKHPDDQIEHLMASIKENGIFRNIVIARDGTILAGHGITEAARRLKLKEVPATRLDLDPMDPKALKVLTGDNETGKTADVDDRALADMLKQIMENGGLEGTGFDPMQLAALAFVTRAEVSNKETAAHWAGMPEFDPGDKAYALNVRFRSEGDRSKFIQQSGIERTETFSNGKILAAWWPDGEEADRSSLKYENGIAHATSLSSVHPVEGKGRSSTDGQDVSRRRNRSSRGGRTVAG